LGAALGGVVLAAGLGYAAPPAVGAVLAAVGVGIALVARRQARATGASPAQPAAVAATD
jgi:DHA1 family inner membrane transport protein